MRNVKAREALAAHIRTALPHVHVIAGASGHCFMELSLGEMIVGSYTAPPWSKGGCKGSAWSRPVHGSRLILWQPNASLDGRGTIDVLAYVPAAGGHACEMVTVDRENPLTPPPFKGRGWNDAALRMLCAYATKHLRYVPIADVVKQLRKDERFEYRINGQTYQPCQKCGMVCKTNCRCGQKCRKCGSLSGVNCQCREW